MHTAIFLDRDGVIIENRSNYVLSWSDVEFFPQAIEAFRKIANSPYKIVIITNQSAIGRGLITLEAAQKINRRIEQIIIKNGGKIDGLFMCPHSPEDACLCRKPQPGLFFQAAQELEIDLPSSIMIGDALTDILAAHNAGIRKAILVKTGRGTTQAVLPEFDQIEGVQVYGTLLEAVQNLPDFAH
jgi:D-glycero-D-manno-heptose 1,7-bisphosphate phosphatase